MRWTRFCHHLEALVFRGRAECDLNEELTAHIELQARKHIAQGMSHEEALRRARIEFGAPAHVREECRDADRWRWIDIAARNLKHCLRLLRKSPGFASIAILILTVGFGSNLAVFSTIDALLLRPLPVQRPSELVRIASLDREGHLGGFPSTILDGLQKDPALNGVCGLETSLLPTEIEGNLRSIGVAGLSCGCLQVLGLPVQLGRSITPGDDRLNASNIAVISDTLWQRQFGRRPDILGKPISVNGEIFTIVGVTGKQFKGLLLGFPQDVMVPLAQTPVLLPNGRKPTYYWVSILARRARGITQKQVLASITAQRRMLLEKSVPHRYNVAQREQYFSQKLAVVSGRNGVDYFLRNRFGQPLFALLGICAGTLLIAGVNLISLLLARSLKRRGEFAVRLALGAKRSHIAGLLLLENAILICTGAGLGAWVGLWTARVILAHGDQMFGNFSLGVGLDSRTVLFLLAMVLVVLTAFTAASFWQAGRLCRSEALKNSGRGFINTSSFPQKILAAVQIALTLAIVSGSALLGASLKHVYNIDFGIKADHVWEVALAARPGGYRHFVPGPYYRDLLQEIQSLPNVASASLTNFIPFLNVSSEDSLSIANGLEAGRDVHIRMLGVGDRFFDTIGAKIIAGNDFGQPDDNSGEPQAILSLSLARYLAHHSTYATQPRDLIGRSVKVGNETEYQHLKVAGIASDVDLSLVNPDETKPFTVYVDLWQHRELQRYPVLLIKTAGSTLSSAAVREVVNKRRREYVERFTTINNEIDDALVENRLIAYLSAGFGTLALAIAAIGLFGLLSYQVSSRTSEIGIRMALGAQRIQIQWLIARQIVAFLVFGCVAGVVLTMLIEKAIRSLLFGVGPHDFSFLLVPILVLIVTAFIAAWIPVQRASAIGPATALRHP